MELKWFQKTLEFVIYVKILEKMEELFAVLYAQERGEQ